MAWIDPAYKTSSCTSDSFVKNSTGKGNYSGDLADCGSSDLYRVKNIYDLAGNVLEWTMESYSRQDRVYRGGMYNDNGSWRPASNRNYDIPPTFAGGDYLGFRPTLLLDAEDTTQKQ